MHRFRCDLDLRQIEEAEAFTFGNHFMGGCRGAFNEQQELLDGLGRLGFPLNPLVRVCGSPAEVEQRYQELMALRHELDYDIDGMVVSEGCGFTKPDPQIFRVAARADTRAGAPTCIV